MPVRSSKGSPGRPSPKSPISVNETDFNRQLRAAIDKGGVRCLHVREADIPGVTDLVVWEGVELLGWLELKIDDHPLETSQKEFMRERRKETDRVYVARFRSATQAVEVYRFKADGSESYLDFIEDYRAHNWTQLFYGWSLMK